MKRRLFFITGMMTALFVYGQSLSPEVTAASGGYFEGANASLSWTLGEPVTETFSSPYGDIVLTQGFQQSAPVSGFSVDLRVFLEGPYDQGLMNTNLAMQPQFPMTQPYGGMPWNYAGAEAITSIPQDMVDWVLVELRDAPNAASAGASTAIARQAGLLFSSGMITGMDGDSPLEFNATVTHNLFVAVWHRNHLGIMSNYPLEWGGGGYLYDFSTAATQVYGSSLAHKEMEPGVWGMVGGDGDGQGQINNADKNDVWVPQAGTSGYLAGDFSMDGQVNNADKNEIWAPNSGKGTQVPDYTPPGGFSCMIPQ